MDFAFVISSILFGLALSMDAFSVSVANGLEDEHIRGPKSFLMAGTFGFFQAVMPMIGYGIVVLLSQSIEPFRRVIPFIAFGVLLFLGVRMIVEYVKKRKHRDSESPPSRSVTYPMIFAQGVATSLDALSVGVSSYDLTVTHMVIRVAIVGVMTFGICLLGVFIGWKISGTIPKYAELCGGIILCLIGIEILVKGLLGY